jgi:hypothetical protein
MATEYAVKSLGKFIDKVGELRSMWGLPTHKELWFRGESKDYGSTALRPELYRPAEGMALKQITELLEIENDLYEEFKRNAVEYVPEGDDWDWDSYFLMQHHECPTRLLDWSDGSLMAIHFAVRNMQHDKSVARVYVLEPDRLNHKLNETPDAKIAEEEWKKYVLSNPKDDRDEDSWEDRYLPGISAAHPAENIPRVPFVLEFPHFTRRIAAQRSRFIVLGTEPNWIAEELENPDSTIRLVTITADCREKIRQELRD